MKKQDRPAKRTFLISLGTALFLLLTAAGFITVDYQGRRLSFGDDALPLEVVDKPGGGKELDVRLMGLETQVDVTVLSDFFDFLCDFGCIPHR